MLTVVLLAQPWATDHGHFMQMGGFKVSMTQSELDDMWGHETPVFETQTKLKEVDVVDGVLTQKCFEALLRKNLITFPPITREEINDKSKGDALSKGIAYLQLAWFIAQIITRAAQGLAITELELTTAALAGLNSAMYLFWWSKPLDVHCPIVLQTKGVQELLKDVAKGIRWRPSASEFSLRIHITQVLHERAKHVAEFVLPLQKRLKKLPSGIKRGIRGTPERMARLLKALKQVLLKRPRSSGEELECKPSESGVQISSHHIPTEHAARNMEEDLTQRPESNVKFSWRSKLKRLGRILLGIVRCLLLFVLFPADILLFIPITAVLGGGSSFTVKFGANEWADKTSMMFYSERVKENPLFGTSAAAGALFGAIHCLAWHFVFPSHVEEIMWRVASLTVVGTCLGMVLALYLLHFSDGPGISRKCFKKFSILLSICFLFFYPISRMCLLVLALTSLRSLPLSAFDTIRWIELVPHI